MSNVRLLFSLFFNFISRHSLIFFLLLLTLKKRKKSCISSLSLFLSISCGFLLSSNQWLSNLIMYIHVCYSSIQISKLVECPFLCKNSNLHFLINDIEQYFNKYTRAVQSPIVVLKWKSESFFKFENQFFVFIRSIKMESYFFLWKKKKKWSNNRCVKHINIVISHRVIDLIKENEVNILVLLLIIS